MTAPTLALTLWPEWAWVIAKSRSWLFPKNVENRSWHPGRRLPVGSRIAIHAGKTLGGRPGLLAADEAVAAVLDMYRDEHPKPIEPFPYFRTHLHACPKSAILCVATIDDYDQERRSKWDVPGQWHWRLRDVVVLDEPIPCKGSQGLWLIPPDIRARLEVTP